MSTRSKDITYFHGTTEPNLVEFELGVRGVGECNTPVNGIWLSKKLAGAQWHAARARNIRNSTHGYVYEVTLKSCATFSDATKPSLPEHVFEKYKNTKNIFRQLFLKNEKWYFVFDKEENAKLRKKYKVPDEYARNRIIDVCRKAGIDGILNPLVVFNKEGDATSVNEPMYGVSLLLINLQKVASIKLVEVI